MLRTVISLSEKDKKWLDKTAQNEHVSMAELIRRAIQNYKQNYTLPHQSPMLESLLKQTSGIWKKEDSVAFVKKLREEWED